jgi:predicted GNAT family N-acyltransferase
MSLDIRATRDIALCRDLRRRVFIDEQGISEADELDDLDDVATHLVANLDGQPAGTARLLVKGDMGKIGRVCVLAGVRGQGIGAALIRAALDEFHNMGGIATVKLGAQTHATGFYEAFGFRATGPVYDDAGLPHRDMVVTLSGA